MRTRTFKSNQSGTANFAERKIYFEIDYVFFPNFDCFNDSQEYILKTSVQSAEVKNSKHFFHKNITF